jgi:hypothetical protein
VDPFIPIKLILIATRFWLRVIGPKWLIGLTALSTFAVLILGCTETY